MTRVGGNTSSNSRMLRNRRASEGIDALGVIPDDADVALAAGQLFDQRALCEGLVS